MTSTAPGVRKADPSPVTPRKAIIAPVAANMAFVLELTLVPLLLPVMQLQFGLSIGDLGWVFNAYGIAVALGVLLGGWCGDVFDRRKVFRFGVACFALGALLVAASPRFEILIAGRVIQGFGAGVFAPLVPLLLTQSSPHRPGRVLIVWGSVAGYVAAFAPLFYGGVLAGYGWQLGFIVPAVLAACAPFFVKGGPASGATSKPAPASAQHLRALSGNRNLWAIYVYVFCTYGSITYYLFRLPVWLSHYDISAASLGLILSCFWLTYSVLSTIMRNMVDGPHIRTIMLAAPILIVAGLPLSYFVESLVLLSVSAVFVGAGLACSNAPSTQLILKFAPKGMSAISASLDITFARLGGIATVVIFAEAQFGVAKIAIGVLCALAILCTLSVSKAIRDIL